MVDMNNPIEHLTDAELGDLLDELPLWSAEFGQELLNNITFLYFIQFDIRLLRFCIR